MSQAMDVCISTISDHLKKINKLNNSINGFHVSSVKLKKLEVCSMLFLLKSNDPFLQGILTCDEKLIRQDNCKSWAQRLDHEQEPKHFPKSKRQEQKIMVTAWRSTIGVLHLSFLEFDS